jgi:CRISPR/Cas system-associated endonuclease Cas1
MSSIEYLLKLKKNIELQLVFFREQLRFVEDMTSFYFDNDKEVEDIETFVQENDLNEFFLDITEDKARDDSLIYLDNRIKQLLDIEKRIEQSLYQICDHTFVKDYIDTFPERSEPIHYCTKCFSNFVLTK